MYSLFTEDHPPTPLVIANSSATRLKPAYIDSLKNMHRSLQGTLAEFFPPNFLNHYDLSILEHQWAKFSMLVQFRDEKVVYKLKNGNFVEVSSTQANLLQAIKKIFENLFDKYRPSAGGIDLSRSFSAPVASDTVNKQSAFSAQAKEASSKTSILPYTQSRTATEAEELYTHHLQPLSIFVHTPKRHIYDFSSYIEEKKSKQSDAVLFDCQITHLTSASVGTKYLRNKVPSDLWNHMLSFLPFDNWRQLDNLSKVCRQFHNLLNRSFLKTMFQRNSQVFNTIPSANLTRQLMAFSCYQAPQLKKAQSGLNDADLNMIAKQGSKLQNLTLNGGSFSTEGFKELIKKLPSLQTVEFNHVNSADFDEYMSILVVHAKKLEKIKIIDCPAMTDQSLFALSLLGNLRAFEYWNSLGNSSLSDFGFVHFFSACTGLETLKIMGCPHVTQASLIILLKTKSQQKLIQQEDEESDTNQIEECKGEQLVELAFAYCGAVNQELFNTIADHCPRLRSFEFGLASNHCQEQIQEKQDALQHLFEECSNLTAVKISDCTYLNEATLLSLLQENVCERLEEFEIYRCTNVRHLIFKKIADCPRLKVFKYEPCTPDSIGYAELSLLSQSQASIYSLGFRNCLLNSQGYLELIKSKPDLQHVQLYQCKFKSVEIGFAGLLPALATHCSQLRTLELEVSQSIEQGFTDQEICQLAKGCRQLDTLHLKIKQCLPQPTFLSSKSLGALGRYCPDLNRLTLSYLDLNQMTPESRADVSLFVGRCQQLVHLGLPFSQISEEYALSLLTKYKDQLVSLDIENISWLVSDAVRAIFLGYSKQLQYLNMSNSAAQDLFAKIAHTFSALSLANIPSNMQLADSSLAACRLNFAHVNVETPALLNMSKLSPKRFRSE
jgi:Ran GTPase-activating protein (RanGAP) involved in mRNA processing and transport